MIRVHLLRLLLPGLLALAVPLDALGQVKEAAQERLRLLNKDAMDEYDSLEFEKAKGLLLEAVEEAKKAGITKGKRLAATYLNLGIIYGAGLNDSLKAVEYFTDALRIDPKANLDASRATPSLEQMFQTAKDNVSRSGTPTPTEADEPFKHVPVDETPPGKPVRIWVRLGAGAGATQAALFYKFFGETLFQRVTMEEKKPGAFLGVIPAAPANMNSIYYYVEAQDDGGQRVHGHGSGASPNIISVKGGPGPGPGKGGKARSRKIISVAVMAGFGAGFVFGGQTENAGASLSKSDDQQGSTGGPGGAIAPFHIAGEVSYHVTEKWHAAVHLRLQLVNGIDKSTGWHSRVSFLGEVLAKRYFGEGPLRFFMAGGLGGGQIRHRIPINPDPRAGTTLPSIDVRVAQYVAFGVGGGLVYMFTDFLGAMINLNGIILVPTFAAHLDTNLGLLVSF